ncbi:pilin [Vibrio fluvialis]|uniref:pilin n=1 Tax=Vibrio fluvialis TaxID=676 RepID=UPI0005CA7654|nr:pilin [Vibrio fluvialis]EKO3932663.1 prepilin-type N-terminal cleavage/methylation domain-containing protein [Vibrio fluvialis]ELS8949331.1 prepilin-type N-terminal cleavage/methylation domain-containing protein [Vibrio fluvialis]EME3971533.1 prepilin-type N-terminal cleavage/methylation domain-containing protein [Vibrio fluvialis]MBL4284237.1 prepilin-type N-terminal cleavage/methylation domain-containing protein [Vibrio fluvialis]MCG6387756.1 prepilin-type N-terminal cleavage/methylation 
MNANQRKQQQGFTLIELMIVVAIIGVLSAIAVPAYKNYVTKSEVASAVATMKSLITPAELYYQENGAFPDTDAKLQEVGVGSNAIKNGALDFTVSNAIGLINFNSISGAKVTITRDSSSGWICSVSGLGAQSSAAPSGCPHS